MTALQQVDQLTVDIEHQRLIIPATVNSHFFKESVRHLAVNPEGSEGGKTLFDSPVTPLDLYEGLESIGAKPGNNMAHDQAENQHVEGTAVDIHVVWPEADSAYPISDLVKDSNGKDFDFHFGGNKETSKEKGTGCLICLDSCYISPVSNAAYSFGAIKKGEEVRFEADANLLPSDQSPVELILSVK